VAGGAVFGALGDLRSWRQDRVGIPVATQAVAHPHAHLAREHLHGLHLAVAALAGDACIHMGAMIEEDMIGQGVDPLPGQGLTGVGDPGELLDGGTVDPGHLVASHAEVHAWNARMPGFVDP